MERRVVITGLGVVSPIGNTTKDFYNALIEGKNGITKITKFDASEYSSQVAGEIKNLEVDKYINPKEARRMDDFVKYGIIASQQAVDDAGLDLEKIDLLRCGCIIGSGKGGIETIQKQHKVLLNKSPMRVSPVFIPMILINMISGNIAIRFGFQGVNYSPVSACATGTHAIGEAYETIKRDDADIMLAGGSEAAISPLAHAGFCTIKALSTRNDCPEKACRPFDKGRDGFIMAEGSGIIVLEELEHAKKRGANIYAELAGYGATCDAFHMTAPRDDGAGGARAMEIAIKKAKINKEDINYINAHGTSTPVGDPLETKVIKNVFKEHAYKLMVSSTKSMTGHLLGAAGGIEAAATALCIKNKVVHPTINYETPDELCDLDYVPNKAREKEITAAISNSLGFGGHNAAILLKKFN